jgi:Ca2+-binding RTX toxin-like protein
VIVGDNDANTLNGTPNDDVIIGNGGADRINGGGGNDKICGGSGGDVIKGGPGNDQLFGQDGPDTLSGGAGADVLSGGAGVDTVTYSGLTADENIDLADNGANDGASGEGDDIRPDVENAIGGNGNDDLEGNDAANQLYGGPGADFMFGLGGNDSLNGETGFDHLFGEGDGVKDKLKCGPPPASGVNGGTAATDDGDTVVNCLT